MTAYLPSRNLLAAAAVSFVLFFCVPPVHASTTCDIPYNFAAGQNAFNLCFSNDGNIVKIESPAGSEHINVGTIGEGYAVCSGASTVYGYDAGFDESGWGPSTVKKPTNGQTFPIVVTRTTTDGTFTLEQTFAINANHSGQSAEREITIAMKLTNVSAATVNNVYITRYADFDVDSGEAGDIFSASRDSVMAQQGVESAAGSGLWKDDPAGHAVSLTGLQFNLARIIEINDAADWIANSHKVCATGASVPGPTNGALSNPAGDYVGRYVIKVGNIAAGATKRVDMVYRRF